MISIGGLAEFKRSAATALPRVEVPLRIGRPFSRRLLLLATSCAPIFTAENPLAWDNTREAGWSKTFTRVPDLVNWFYGSVGQNMVYANNLCQVTTGGVARFDPLEIRLRGIANP